MDVIQSVLKNHDFIFDKDTMDFTVCIETNLNHISIYPPYNQTQIETNTSLKESSTLQKLSPLSEVYPIKMTTNHHL